MLACRKIRCYPDSSFEGNLNVLFSPRRSLPGRFLSRLIRVTTVTDERVDWKKKNDYPRTFYETVSLRSSRHTMHAGNVRVVTCTWANRVSCLIVIRRPPTQNGYNDKTVTPTSYWCHEYVWLIIRPCTMCRFPFSFRSQYVRKHAHVDRADESFCKPRG